MNNSVNSKPATPTPTLAVPSPCISVCVMDTSTGLCTGCTRTIDEIATWGMMSNAEKSSVWRNINSRRAT